MQSASWPDKSSHNEGARGTASWIHSNADARDLSLLRQVIVRRRIFALPGPRCESTANEAVAAWGASGDSIFTIAGCVIDAGVLDSRSVF